MQKYLTTNSMMQVGLVSFTILGALLTSLKFPQYGLISYLISEIFWLYSSYKAWKNANQIGLFINTIFMAAVILFGVINYWFM